MTVRPVPLAEAFVVFFELLQKIVEIFRKNLPLPFNGCKINP